MKIRFLLIVQALLLFGSSGALVAETTNATRQVPVVLPGPKPDGSILLPNGWSLRPVGKQIPLGDFPVNMALHPRLPLAAILHSGYGQHEIIVVDWNTKKLVARTPIEETFYGLAFSANGDRLYASGASEEVVHEFSFKNRTPEWVRSFPLRDVKERGIPAGLAVSRDGKTLFVANVWGQQVTRVDVATGQVKDFLLGTSHQQPTQAVAPSTLDEASIRKRAEAAAEQDFSKDPFPYTCVLDEPRHRVYVSLWAQSQIAVLDSKSGERLASWSTEDHPNEMVLDQAGRFLYVANANRNTVTVIETATGNTVETLLAELLPGSPPGNTPNSLALSPDNRHLYVANANINTVAVFDISTPRQSRSLGFIPVGWYPTSVRVTPDGAHLLVVNGKGLVPKANRHGPKPGPKGPAETVREYIGGLMQGTVSIIDLPKGNNLETLLKRYTAEALLCLPSRDSVAKVSPELRNVLSSNSPIKYVFYIIKENRTYDQVLGDLPQGLGDPSLCLFPEKITPNHHAIARDFVLLDNFYVESEVSADGHEWTMGAYATDFIEKSWPLSYGHNSRKKYPYPSEGNFPIATPAGGYLWDRAKAARVSYRSYGEFISNAKSQDAPGTTRIKALQGHFDPFFRSFDMTYPDVKRAARFISELRRYEQSGGMPRLNIIRLPNDHTSGTSPGLPTPFAALADNDLAFGQVVEAISHSKFWSQSAIFVVEDDAQNGSDHIDAHRTVAFAISPYIRRQSVDSTIYTTSSMLRTMELILGLQPMSQFDALANPMIASFQAQPDLRPYTVRPVTVNLNERNLRSAYGSEQSRKMNFTREDAADDLVLNRIIWHSIKGENNPMPAPTRAAFVFPTKTDWDD